ncbi:MAG TPA: hypothetical protein PK417_14125 [Hyphomonas sp.]|nr:hypothetical protein [Hyphomonas sp.]
MRAIILALAAWSVGTAAADVQKVVTNLPGSEEFEAPEALQDMQEGVVWLDLTIAPSLEPSIEMSDGTYSDNQCDGHGPVDAKSVSVSTGSNHMLLEVRVGTPELNAANLVSCDYAPQYMSDFDPGHVTRVKGCYFAHATSIPTAVWWILNPLPASACGFGD